MMYIEEVRGGEGAGDDNDSNGVVGGKGSGGGGGGGKGVAKVWFVGIGMRSNLTYQDIFIVKYGREGGSILVTIVLRPKGLYIDPKI